MPSNTRKGNAHVNQVVRLKPREAEVAAELAADGATNQQIAERLGLSEDTVKTYMRGLRKATGIKDRTELAVALVRRRIIVSIIR